MNCKPGDLAYVVTSMAGNEGRIVTVRKWLGRVPRFCGEDRWEIDEAINGTYGSPINHVRDSQLRPILPPPGSVTTDEVAALYAPKVKVAA